MLQPGAGQLVPMVVHPAEEAVGTLPLRKVGALAPAMKATATGTKSSKRRLAWMTAPECGQHLMLANGAPYIDNYQCHGRCDARGVWRSVRATIRVSCVHHVFT